MNNIDNLIAVLSDMKENPINNYVLPGITSSLITNGRVRMFEATRHPSEYVRPHSHRYDFACLVLEGAVANHTWSPTEYAGGDAFTVLTQTYKGTPGEYDLTEVYRRRLYQRITNTYEAGEVYTMKHNEIHSIAFKRDTKVLFFEGPELGKDSTVLVPLIEEG